MGGAGAADELGRVKETLLTLPEEVIKDVGLEVAAPTSGRFPHSTRILLACVESTAAHCLGMTLVLI